MQSVKDGLYFSTLDAKSGYWTKNLEQESQLLTAFNTPLKKYCFLLLPFSLSVSAEIFCEHMDRILAGIPVTFPCADDVKIQGSTGERHDIHLLETVDKAAQAGLILASVQSRSRKLNTLVASLLHKVWHPALRRFRQYPHQQHLKTNRNCKL
eukprot:gene18442-20291_t